MKRTNVAVWLPKYNRWQINVQKDGVRKTFSCATPGRTGQRMCHAKADAWLDDGIRDTHIRVDHLFDEYIEELKKTTSKSHWASYESLGRVWIKPVLGKRKIGDVDESHLQSVITKAYHTKDLSKKTLQNIRAALMNFIKYCRKRKLTSLRPEDLTIPKSAKRGKKNILQPEHMALLFREDTTIRQGKRAVDPFIHAYRFQVLTGLRPGELVGLRWSDIRGRHVFISQSINDKNEITAGKTEHAQRHFVLSDLAAAELEQHRLLCDPSDERVFEDLKQQTYRRYWYRYCEANGIPRTTPYEMRHTFVSVAKSLPEGQLKQLVGHTKNMDTFGVYAHEVSGELQQTASRLDEIFSEILGEKHT